MTTRINVRGSEIELFPKTPTEDWVKFNGRAISFEELYYVLKWIGDCEDRKYPEVRHRGRYMVSDFCKDAICGWESYSRLAIKYKLPGAPVPPGTQVPLL